MPWLPLTTRILSRLCGVALKTLGNLSLSACISYHASPHSLPTRNTWSVAMVSQTCHDLSTSMPLQTLFPLPGTASIHVSPGKTCSLSKTQFPCYSSVKPILILPPLFGRPLFYYHHLPRKAVMRIALEAACKMLSTACSGHHELECVWTVGKLTSLSLTFTSIE